MKSRKSQSVLILCVSALCVILYIFFAARPLSKEYLYNPEWTLNLTSEISTNISPEEKISYFKLGQDIGYFTDSGKLTLLKSFPNKSSISNSYFATYNTQANNIELFDSKGNKKGIFDDPGFPAFYDDRIYIFLPGGGIFSKCAQNGKRQWINENVIPITAFASNKNFTTSGYADGSIRLLNNEDGSTVFEYEPDGSDYPIILGLDISPNSKYIACLSGHSKQRFSICKNDDNKPKIIFHKYLDSETNSRALIKFSKDSNIVYYSHNQGLGIYNIDKNKEYNIKISDRIININETDDFIFILTKKDNLYTIYLLEKTNILQGSFSFTAESAFITTIDNILYVGKDNTISKLNIKRD